ncbi:unnamed protein product [Pleuronectes platessa]|uniref:Solute carrier family 25 member 53 n=1 Tax=Pleuronectes platessa TaxID=8262 RepID=A0A9N7W1Z6_PLEPL|nr:unnamed protein product [Pleuronectes platessa]
MQTLKGTLLFGLQEAILHQLPLSSQSVISTSALPALAGFGAGLVEAVVFTPFERVQNVLQDGRNYRDLPTLKSVLVRLRGQTLTLGYYRAFLPIAARNALGSSIYFGLKGPVCAAVAGEWCHPMASSFVSGALTSLVGSLAIYPLSVLVANMQAQPGGERTLSLRSLHQNSFNMEGKSPKVNAEVEHFDKCKLKPTTTNEKNFIPTKKDIEDEKRENEKPNVKK